MKLTYRGVSYNYEPPPIDMMEGEVGGKYRGQPWTVSYPRHIPVPQPALSLKYRGVSYQTGDAANAGVPAPATPVANVPIWAVSPRNASHTVVSEVSKIHRDNICQNLERRIEAAKARGDRQLLQMLEQESQQLTCSL